MTLVLASSGMRLGESLMLELDDIDLEINPVKINIGASYTKTNKKRITFISSEVKELLQEWMG